MVHSSFGCLIVSLLLLGRVDALRPSDAFQLEAHDASQSGANSTETPQQRAVQSFYNFLMVFVHDRSEGNPPLTPPSAGWNFDGAAWRFNTWQKFEDEIKFILTKGSGHSDVLNLFLDHIHNINVLLHGFVREVYNAMGKGTDDWPSVSVKETSAAIEGIINELFTVTEVDVDDSTSSMSALEKVNWGASSQLLQALRDFRSDLPKAYLRFMQRKGRRDYLGGSGYWKCFQSSISEAFGGSVDKYRAYMTEKVGTEPREIPVMGDKTLTMGSKAVMHAHPLIPYSPRTYMQALFEIMEPSTLYAAVQGLIGATVTATIDSTEESALRQEHDRKQQEYMAKITAFTTVVGQMFDWNWEAFLAEASG